MSRIEPRTIPILGGDLELRSPGAVDSAPLLEMMRAALDETAFLKRSSAESTISTSDYAAMLERTAGSETDVFVTAVSAGRHVGLGNLTGSSLARFRHEVTLALAVRKEAWGRGIGSALLDTLIAWADSRGLVRVSLEVDSTNERAIRLYRSRGFETEGVLRARKKLGSNYVDNLIMARLVARDDTPAPPSSDLPQPVPE